MGLEAISFEERILEYQSKSNFVEFDKRNKAQNFGFASFKQVSTTLQPDMWDLGIYIRQVRTTVLFNTIDEAGFMRCGVHRQVTLGDVYSDKTVVYEGVGEGKCKQGTSFMKACTAALKYALQASALVAWDDSDDQELLMDDKEPAPKKVAIPKQEKENGKKGSFL